MTPVSIVIDGKCLTDKTLLFLGFQLIYDFRVSVTLRLGNTFRFFYEVF